MRKRTIADSLYYLLINYIETIQNYILGIKGKLAIVATYLSVPSIVLILPLLSYSNSTTLRLRSHVFPPDGTQS